MKISVIVITKDSEGVLESALRSVSGLYDELLVGDSGSTDGTVEMVKKYGGKIIRQIQTNPTNLPITKNLGERKQELVERAKGDWILVLDADERVSPKLFQEIRRITTHHKIRLEHKNVMDPRRSLPRVFPRGRDDRRGGGDDKSIVAYRIPYQNYVFGRPVYYGGEKYTKVRLFKKGCAWISPEPLHEEVMVYKNEMLDSRRSLPRTLMRGGNDKKIDPNDNMIGNLSEVIHHHSYRTPWQLFSKFTRYAWMAAGILAEKRDKVTLQKLFLYAPHMFWARYVKERGYKDGWRGLVLASAFGYMEGLTYWMVLVRRRRPDPGSEAGMTLS